MSKFVNVIILCLAHVGVRKVYTITVVTPYLLIQYSQFQLSIVYRALKKK
jgi:hypothetical protein